MPTGRGIIHSNSRRFVGAAHDLDPFPILVNPNRAIPPPILVPPGRNIPPPILVVPPERQIDMSAPRTHASLQRRVDAFLKTAPRASAMGPMNPERFPSTNLTPMNEFGVSRTGYNVNGELWVKVAAVVPNAKPTWFDLGRITR